MMNLRHIEVFFALMTCGTVTEAARQLRVTQPSVTTTIKQAEYKLGFSLFERQSGRLIPTAEAQILFEEASRAHESLETIRNLAERMRSGHAGHVHIAGTNTLSMAVLPEAIATFQLKHERYSYSVSTMNTEEILTQLDERTGTYHLGFTHGVNDYKGLNTIDIGETELLCLCPASWKLPNKPELDLGTLSDKPYISTFASTPIGTECTKLFADYGFKPRVVANMHSHYLAGALVQQGVGYTIIDAITVRTLLNTNQGGGFVIKRFAQEPKMPIVAVFPGSRSLTDPARYFIDCFLSSFKKTVAIKLP